MTDEYEAALDKILAVVELLNKDMNEHLGNLDLTPSRAHVLWILRRGPSTQRALADAVRVTPRTITGLVDALVDTGFVTRESHPSDRRATLVSLTKHGIKTMKTMERDHGELSDLLFGGMPPHIFDSFVMGLDEVLGRLRDALEHD
jgi:DNA-binding MarR family transcriptional regulator